MKTVKIGETIIGEGFPKIIVPLVGKTREDLFSEARNLQEIDCDIVEWRIDFFEEVTDAKATAAFSYELKKILAKPLLVTFRSKREGGELELSDTNYFAIYHEMLENGVPDLLDVELFMPEKEVRTLIAAAKEKKVTVVMCNHDFFATPAKEEIIQRLRLMQEKGADICKIAVMPNSAQDVLTLLSATDEMYRLYADRPIITMSMGDKGMISRVSGQLFGSAATFGAAQKASAPGQVPVSELRSILKTLAVK